MLVKSLKVICGRVDFQVRMLGANRQKIKYSSKVLPIEKTSISSIRSPQNLLLSFGWMAAVELEPLMGCARWLAAPRLVLSKLSFSGLERMTALHVSENSKRAYEAKLLLV